jgi:hypothetical protein
MPPKKGAGKTKTKAPARAPKGSQGKVSRYFKRIESKAIITVGSPEEYLQGPVVDQHEYVQLLAGVSRAVAHVAIE